MAFTRTFQAVVVTIEVSRVLLFVVLCRVRPPHTHADLPPPHTHADLPPHAHADFHFLATVHRATWCSRCFVLAGCQSAFVGCHPAMPLGVHGMPLSVCGILLGGVCGMSLGVFGMPLNVLRMNVRSACCSPCHSRLVCLFCVSKQSRYWIATHAHVKSPDGAISLPFGGIKKIWNCFPLKKK